MYEIFRNGQWIIVDEGDDQSDKPSVCAQALILNVATGKQVLKDPETQVSINWTAEIIQP